MNSEIPQNPNSPVYRLGSTLGEVERVWFRAKMFGQYRLFFRFDSASKIIVYVWVNDEESLRAYGSKTDAYALFKRMLDGGYPPGTFEELLKQSREI
jgi:toxin YhaV